MKNGAACVKDTNDFINKVKNNDTPNHALLVTAVVGLYTRIPHEVCFKALRNTLENRNHKEMPTENLSLY